MGSRLDELSIPCAACGAGVEERCRTKTGRRVSYRAHAARMQPLYSVWTEGFEEGQADIINAMISAEGGDSWGEKYIEHARKRVERQMTK